MVDIFGGLWLERLLEQGPQYDFLCRLLDQKIIDGIQLRVAHPDFTPAFTDTESIGHLWPGKMLVHVGAENTGVDPGENFDEFAEYKSRANSRSWETWNRQTIDWALRVASVFNAQSCIHPGYGFSADDQRARDKVISLLSQYKSAHLLLENVPPVVDSRYYSGAVKETWDRNSYWGFGGVPLEMKSLLDELGPEFQCLIDWSHLLVTTYQSQYFNKPALVGCDDLETVIEGFLALPHSDICHYSGSPPRATALASHKHFAADHSPVLIQTMKEHMSAICLEIAFSDFTEFDSVTRSLEQFREILA
ncbi:hypothetical protein HQ571_05495 [Candidatus Kuenenbacteria bacterium]|nr:hypothetical protein [Candidatus Kuenenbacteria bacterium]